MIYVDDSTIKVGGLILPGLCKSLEVKTEAQVEEQEVEGSTAKPKQATGYEDGKVAVELVLIDGPSMTKEEKLRQIQNLFRRSGQETPEVHQIVNEHTARRGVKKVVFKSLTTKETNKKDEITASLEFWEYVPMTITSFKTSVSPSGSVASTPSSSGLSEAYTSYLESSRGKAPKISDKTSSSPAVDDE